MAFACGYSRPILSALLVAVVMYWAHRVLQLQHHRHCKADLIRVVLFNQSVMCAQISNVLSIVEATSNQAVRHVAAHVLGVLGSLAFAAAAVGASARHPQPASSAAAGTASSFGVPLTVTHSIFPV
jgi:hypothetical protein